VTELQTPRLSLHAIDTAEGERIVERRAGAGDDWAEDYPFDGDVMGVTAFLRNTAAHGDQRPFGHYRITRTADGKAIGGIGFKGQPDDGCVEVGYGLSPSARGHGYAAEALAALLNVAADRGLARVVADTTADNVASQRTLERAGFRQTGTNGDLYLYELLLDARLRTLGEQGPTNAVGELDGVQVLYPSAMDEFDWAMTEAKGWIEVTIRWTGGDRTVTFYDPVRLAQEVQSALAGPGYFTERTSVVIPTLSKKAIEAVVALLAQHDFADIR
jgi:RimJ/RimL family protein N-acetyltransferase